MTTPTDAVIPPAAPKGSDWLAKPVGDETQRIRVATTMTGGVSLAVWIGGVARELNLLLQASERRPRRARTTAESSGQPTSPAAASDLTAADAAVRDLYGALLGLLDVVVDVDVLSGTSAGGINAVLLALCRVQRRDLGRLRSLWLDVGSLLELLRAPTDPNVASLLYGDEYMLAQLDAHLPHLPRYAGAGAEVDEEDPHGTQGDAATPRAARNGAARDAEAKVPSTTLYVTTTLLTGESSRFTDAIGTQVQASTQRGLFVFDEQQLSADDGPVLGALALAARSTASFPGAFEPSFIPFDTPVSAAGKTPERPAMAAYTDLTRAHWVADGGLLDNQPLDVLLQRIFDEPAREPVRRVLLYVVPSTGPTPDLAVQTSGDLVEKPYGLVEALLKDLTAATSQSIARDLDAIRSHNDNVDARYDLRRQLAELGTRLGPGERLLSLSALDASERRQRQLQARPLVRAMLRAVSTWPQDAVPTEWWSPLQPGGAGEARCRDAMVAELAPRGPDEDPPPDPVSMADFASYGRVTFDAAKSILLWVLRTAHATAGENGDAKELLDALAGLHAAGRPDPAADGPQRARRVRPSTLAREVCKNWLTTGVPASLEKAARLLARTWREKTAVEPQSWETLNGILSDDMLQRLRRLAGLRESIEATGAGSPGTSPSTAGSGSSDGRAAGRGSGALVGGDPPNGGAIDQGARTDRFSAIVDYLSRGGAEKATVRLFDLAATELSILPPGAFPAQAVELIQVSADTRSLLAPSHRTAASKLTGLQAHHFGAFYKRSWRANDWMWGRLDGSGWLVHVLLDPRRLADVVDRRWTTNSDAPAATNLEGTEALVATATVDAKSDAPPDQDGSCGQEDPHPKATWLVNRLKEISQLSADPGPKVWDELVFLDQLPQDRTLPLGVPRLSLWLAQAWQRRIAAQELPDLADTILGPAQPSGSSGSADGVGAADWSPTWTREWAREVRNARDDVDALTAKLDTCPVPEETFLTDRGSPLFARTLTKAAATLTAAAASVPQLPTAARPAVSTARTVAVGGYRVVDSVKGRTRTLLLVGFGLLAVGIALALQSATILGFTGLGLAAVGGYALAVAVWQKSAGLLGALLAVTGIAAVGSLAIPAERRALFGTSAKDCNADSANCIVGRHEYWLGSQWWHPLLAVGILLTLLVILPLLVRAVSRGISNRRERTKARKARNKAAADDDATGRTMTTGRAMPAMSGHRVSDKT